MAKTYSKIILAGLAGLAAGLAVGVLVAPAKGTKTRKRLKKKFRKMEEIFQQSGLS
jgi:gas vesicle protein